MRKQLLVSHLYVSTCSTLMQHQSITLKAGYSQLPTCKIYYCICLLMKCFTESDWCEKKM